MPFVLHFLGTDNSVRGPVRDDKLQRDSAPEFSAEHAGTARRFGSEVAQRAEANVLMSRVDPNGRRTPTLVLTHDGRTEPPPQAVETGQPHVDGPWCFCRRCRAARGRGL